MKAFQVENPFKVVNQKLNSADLVLEKRLNSFKDTGLVSRSNYRTKKRSNSSDMILYNRYDSLQSINCLEDIR